MMEISNVGRFKKIWKQYLFVEWRRLINFVKDQRFIETIDLDITYEPLFDHGDTLDDFVKPKERKRTLTTVKNSTCCKFLEGFKDKISITDDAIKKTEYYQEILKCMLTYGHYQEIRDEAGLIQYCRKYFDYYRSLERKMYSRKLGDNIQKVIHPHYPDNNYPCIFKVREPRYFLIWDGLHRLSCQCILGKRFVKARVLGVLSGHPDDMT